MAVKDWSTTAASNTAILGAISTDGTVMTVSQVDNAFREMAAQIADQLGKMGFEGADIASATTTNLANATGWSLDITGTTTITGLGTVDAGQMFILRFTGALTLTHNATSLILPGAANITTAAGDVAIMKSEGSGNWRCLAFTTASGLITATSASKIKGVGTNLGTAFLQFVDIASTRLGFVGAASSGNAHVSLGSDIGDIHINSAAAVTVTGATTFEDDIEVGAFSSTGASVGKDIALSTIANLRSSTTLTTSATHQQFFNPNGAVGTITTTGSATAFNTSSDGRRKKNLRDFDSGGFLDALEVWHFDWISGGSGYGVIAQDAQKVFPDAISEGEDGYLVADYSKFVPLLLAEVKKLRARVAALES